MPGRNGGDPASLPAPESQVRPLSRRQQAFIEAYLKTWNASEAARLAGYRGKSNVQGPRLLANISIQARIAERIQEAAMEANEILARLSDQARINIGDFYTLIDVPPGEKGNGPDKRWILDMEKIRARGHLVKKVKQSKEGIELELYDAQNALIQLGKHAGLFKDLMEHSGINGQPIQQEITHVALTDAERAQRVAELLDAARARRAG